MVQVDVDHGSRGELGSLAMMFFFVTTLALVADSFRNEFHQTTRASTLELLYPFVGSSLGALVVANAAKASAVDFLDSVAARALGYDFSHCSVVDLIAVVAAFLAVMSLELLAVDAEDQIGGINESVDSLLILFFFAFIVLVEVTRFAKSAMADGNHDLLTLQTVDFFHFCFFLFCFFFCFNFFFSCIYTRSYIGHIKIIIDPDIHFRSLIRFVFPSLRFSPFFWSTNHRISGHEKIKI